MQQPFVGLTDFLSSICFYYPQQEGHVIMWFAALLLDIQMRDVSVVRELLNISYFKKGQT